MRLLDDTREKRVLTARGPALVQAARLEPDAQALPLSLLAMLNELDESALEQLERLLNSQLSDVPRAAEERESLLGALIEMRAELGGSPSRKNYDARRPDGSPTSTR